MALAGEQRLTALATIPEWSEVEGRDAIKRDFSFKDFKEAWAWMNVIAPYADGNDHHPEWFNVYNTVKVVLATHTASGVTEKDIDLATFMDKAYAAQRAE